MPVIALQACSEPTFVFRDYTSRSDCQDVIDSELGNGGIFEGAYDADLASDFRLVTELSGAVFAEPVEIDITCARNGFVSSIHYVKHSAEASASAELFERFSAELASLYGAPAEFITEDARSRTFLCGDPATVMVTEWKLSEMEYEVSLLIVPHRTDCR